MIQPDTGGLYHPNNEAEVIELVEHAIDKGLHVRVRGAAQSVKSSVFTDDFDPSKEPPGNNINIELDQLRAVNYLPGMQVTVGGGCNLGYDPFDPSETSSKNESNNLFFQLNQKGLSIKNVPNAIHQTVAGYISTGSSGGTMQHSFDESILAIRIVDGTATPKTFTKSNDLDDHFYGAVVSMGLLGIIIEVTLQCVSAFDIVGQEAITHIKDCEFDFLGPGDGNKPPLKDFLANAEFSRVLWWPFKTLQRAIVWKARTMQNSDYNSTTGVPPHFVPKPYQPLFPTWGSGSTLTSEAVAATCFQLIATWPDWFYELMGIDPEHPSLEQQLLITLGETLFPVVYPLLTDLYFPCCNATHPPRVFWDNWVGSLPMDKVEYSNNLFDLVYCEMWVPANLATQTVNILNDFYEKNGYSATGFYTVEILAAKKSNFWLSPAFGTDVIRINILFFQKSVIKANDYFSQFWKLLFEKGINFRPHWGKKLPLPDSTTGTSYLKNQYPKWDNFMDLREQMDPNKIFLNNYWKAQLGIE
ncbi:MAG TPA: D-arabinono-1,4-lactone oxidase [Mucilaginibacter sp.]|jgi:hypothetical protein